MKTLPPIVLIEDNSDDVFFFKRLLGKTGVQNPVLRFADGTAAVAYLIAVNSNPDGILPLIIFSDLKMSMMSGLEVVRWVREQPNLATLALFIVSGSDLERDVQRCNEAGTNGYILKFPTSDELAGILKDAGGTFKVVVAVGSASGH